MPGCGDPVLVDESSPAAVGGGEAEEGGAAHGDLERETRSYDVIAMCRYPCDDEREKGNMLWHFGGSQLFSFPKIRYV